MWFLLSRSFDARRRGVSHKANDDMLSTSGTQAAVGKERTTTGREALGKH